MGAAVTTIDLSEYSLALLDYVTTTYGPDLQPVQVAVFAEIELVKATLRRMNQHFDSIGAALDRMLADCAEMVAILDRRGTTHEEQP